MFQTVGLRVKRLHEAAKMPTYKTTGAVGFDLETIETVVLAPKERRIIRTGLAFQIPGGFEIQIRSRSGKAAKTPITVHPGTIDQDYRGEVGVIVENTGETPFEIPAGSCFAQGVLAPVWHATFIETEYLSETARGDGGFGSTGA